MIAFDTKATEAEVKITSPKASKEIGRFHFQKSFHDVFQAAAYSSGGRKIRNTRSGCKLIEGIPGIRLINKPLTTRRIGYEILSLLLTIVRIAMPNSKEITISRLSCNMKFNINFFI